MVQRKDVVDEHEDDGIEREEADDEGRERESREKNQEKTTRGRQASSFFRSFTRAHSM